VDVDTEGFAVESDSAGTTMVRLHWTPYWNVTAGEACLAKSPQGFTRVKMDEPGWIRVRARYTPWRARGDGPFCSGAPVENSD
jgi:hypothetical protein